MEKDYRLPTFRRESVESTPKKIMLLKTHTTGIHYTDREVEWVVMQKDRSGIEKVNEGKLSIPHSFFKQETTQLFPAEILAEDRKNFKGIVTVSLPSFHLLMRVLELPSIDPSELADMVELQTDQFSPFPIDQLTISYEVLHQTSDHSRVLAVAAQRKSVDQLGELMKENNIYIRSLDAGILAWWSLLKTYANISQEGRVILILEDHTEFSMIVLDDGVPVCFRSLELFRDLSTPSVLNEIEEEVRYTLLALEAAYGTNEEVVINFWSTSDIPDALMKRLSGFAPLGVHLYDLTTLPTLSEGLALRSADRRGLHAELVPREWIELQRRKQIIRVSTIVSIVVLGVWMAVMSVTALVFGIQTATFNQIKKEATTYEAPARSAQAARVEMLSLEKYADRSHSALECLREITEFLPSSVEINSFSYTKGNAIHLRGSSQTSESIYDYFQKLGRSALFTELKNEKVNLQIRQGNRIQGFSLTAKLPKINSEEPR